MHVRLYNTRGSLDGQHSVNALSNPTLHLSSAKVKNAILRLERTNLSDLCVSIHVILRLVLVLRGLEMS